MAKHALSLFVKIALFAATMLIVAKAVPYDGLIDSVTGLFDFQSASALTSFILGEPDLEVWYSLHEYVAIVINTLISVPVLSAIITVYYGITRKVSVASLPGEWAFSTLRRFAKIFTFTLLFWALLRFLPYQSVFPDGQTYSAFTMAALVGFNLFLTIAGYWFITRKIIIMPAYRNLKG